MDPKTRTAKARLEFPNPAGELKPEMFGEVLLKGQGRKGLLVPLDAVLDAGAYKVVFVALGDGKFEPREVGTGTTVGEKIEVRTGLKETVKGLIGHIEPEGRFPAFRPSGRTPALRRRP